MGRLFGTDGVRGVANSELTPGLAYKLGVAVTHFLTDAFMEKGNRRPKILIGMDTRRSGHMLEAAMTAGVTSAGGDAISAGVLPTPGVAYLVKKYGLDGGAVISASHNPFLDNGIKFFDRNGYKMSDESEAAIERVIDVMGVEKVPRPVGGNVGIRGAAERAVEDYVDYLKYTAGGADLSGLDIAMDCANGAAYRAAPALFSGLNAKIDVISDAPDGENINLRCGSTHMAALIARVKERKRDIGVALDGDGDRCLAVDETGAVVDGDQIMAILAYYYKSKGMLTSNTLVATIMSNMGLGVMCAEHGITLEKTDVGDKYVLERMLKKGYSLGGEQSGHIIALEHGTTGDGLLTALQLAKVMSETGGKLSELSKVMEKFPQVLINARISNERKRDYMTSTEISNAIKRLEERFEGRGRLLVRPSGTEPLIRVMLEGRDINEITAEAQSLTALIEDVLM